LTRRPAGRRDNAPAAGAARLSVVGLIAALGGASCFASPAWAQLAGTLSLSSNEMFRGETISRGDPALSLALSLDSPEGLFAGAGASVAAGDHEPRLSSLVQYAGYALRRDRTSFEVGLIHRRYDTVFDGDVRRDFFEAYAGISHGAMKARIYVSPDYHRSGRTSYYGEVNARLLSVEKWSIDGHAGLALTPHDTGRKGLRDHYDWRLQASRPIGRLFLSLGVAGTSYPVYSPSGKARGFVSLSHAF